MNAETAFNRDVGNNYLFISLLFLRGFRLGLKVGEIFGFVCQIIFEFKTLFESISL